MFTAVLFAIAKKWKQPKCPPADEWVTILCCIYTMEHYSDRKKMPFAAIWMDLEISIRKQSKSERERQIPYDITYVWNINMTQMNLTMKQKSTHSYRDRFMVAKGEGAVREYWIGSLELADGNYSV